MKVLSAAVALLICNHAYAKQLSSQSSSPAKFESDFVDMDDNDAEIDQQIVFENNNEAENDVSVPQVQEQSPPVAQNVTSIVQIKSSTDAKIQKKEALQKSLEKIQKNIEQSKTALAQHSKHVQELDDIIKATEGPAQNELIKVKENAKKHVKDLEDHIKHGEELVKQKQKSIQELEGASKPKASEKAAVASKTPQNETQKALVQTQPSNNNVTAVVQTDQKSKAKLSAKASIKQTKDEIKLVKDDVRMEGEDKQLDPKDVKDVLAKNDKLWQDKMGSALANFKEKMSAIQKKYAEKLQQETENHKKLVSQSENTFQAEIQGEKKKSETLKTMHEQEVKDIFEDEKTLDFIKQMRQFKQDWQADQSVAKRKKTAADMATATKKWISSY